MQQILVWLRESTGDPAENRVHSAGRQTRLEELFGELDRVTARETIADRQRRYRRLKPGPEMTRSDLPGSLAGAASAALRTAHALAAMLGDHDRDHGELFDLVTRGLARRDPVALAEHVATIAARRPVIEEFINSPRRKQRPPVTPMSWLPARLAPRTVLPAPRHAPRGIRARRPRGVPRVLRQLTLELLHPRLQLHDAAIHRQQNFDYRLPPRVIDRLRLNPLHATRFDEAELCPPTN